MSGAVLAGLFGWEKFPLQPGLNAEEAHDADGEPAPGALGEDSGFEVDAGVLQVGFDQVPVLKDGGPGQAPVFGVPFGVVVPFREAGFFVVEAAPVRVRVAVRRAALFGAGAFPPAFQNNSAKSGPLTAWKVT